MDELAVPFTSAKLTQWVGRLLRTETDTGRISILDNRLSNTGYGRKMLVALPAFKAAQETMKNNLFPKYINLGKSFVFPNDIYGSYQTSCHINRVQVSSKHHQAKRHNMAHKKSQKSVKQNLSETIGGEDVE